MRIERHGIVSCLVILSLLMTVGCSKKTEEQKTTSITGAMTQAPSVDTEKPIGEVQAQADTMSVDNLRATALKYKEAILQKQSEIEKLAAKIKEIPIAEALGQEAKTLKTDLQNVETALKDLKDHFQVYYDTLKKKGGDLSGLTV
jgi:hypothetical protein